MTEGPPARRRPGATHWPGQAPVTGTQASARAGAEYIMIDINLNCHSTLQCTGKLNASASDSVTVLASGLISSNSRPIIIMISR